MYRKRLITLLLVMIIAYSFCLAQKQVMYKQIDTTKLYLEIYYPEKVLRTNDNPAMVFFFGGGWNGGDRYHFVHHASYFAKRGLVCFLVDYRTKSKNHTTPFESLKDAKSAIRYIRNNASVLGIDATKIIASGGSAGGHLAAAAALIDDYNETSDDMSVSPVPDALVLFNPVIDNGPGGYGFERIGEKYRTFSPLHNIRRGAPPTIFFLGTNDKLIPVETAEYYKKVMEKVGSRCDLKLFEDEGHGFFNYNNHENFKRSVLQADKFLQSIGYLNEEPNIEIE